MDEEKDSPQSKDVSRFPFKVGVLHVEFVRGHDLKAMDRSGLSDPYARILYNGRKIKTKVHKKTLHCLWGEQHTLTDIDLSKDSEIIVQVKDHDRFSKNEFMGQCKLDLNKVLDDDGIFNGWVLLWDKDGKERMEGAIELKLALLDSCQELSVGKKLISSLPFCQAKVEEREIKVWIGSWNVGNAFPGDIAQWIPKTGYDLYVIGVQECKYEVEHCQSCDVHWKDLLVDHFASEAELVKHQSLGEMRCTVFATDKSRILRLDSATEATGIGHVWSNKGGIAISFDYNHTSLCFVSSHLAAHQGMTKNRNSDYGEIAQGVTQKMEKGLFSSYHHVFWMGDLNYRVQLEEQGDDEEPPPQVFEHITAMVNKKEFDNLYKLDQLVHEINNDRAFVGFKQMAPSFPPTFKVLRGKKQCEYTEKRAPSWCDRILYRSIEGFPIIQTEFNSCLELDTSDHKPVYATFKVPTYRLPPIDGNEAKMPTLKFTKLQCLNLTASDIGGTSDPYLIIRSRVLGVPIVTSHCRKNLNPEWTGKDLPEAGLVVNHRETMEKSFLAVHALDKDNSTTDDYIGHCALPLKPVMTSSPWSFEVPLMFNGVPAGTVSGTLVVDWK